MKTVVRVVFGTYQLQGGAQSVLGPAGCGPDVAKVDEDAILKGINVEVTLEEKDPRVPVLFEILKQHGKTWLEDHEDVYTEEELDSARLLLIRGNRQCELDGGVEYGTIYDLSGACPRCGTGGRQTSPLFINGEDIKKLEGHRAGETYFNHILVDERLAKEIERTGATGLSFRDVIAVWRDGRMFTLPWKQLAAVRTLPRMAKSTTGLARHRPCERCFRNGYRLTRDEPLRVVYRAADLEGVDDVSWSWENDGHATLRSELRESKLSQPWVVVTPKVRRVFRDAGVTSLDWFPVRVEEG